MKKVINLFLIIVLINSCSAQKKITYKNTKIMIPIVDKKFEMFNKEYSNLLYKIDQSYLSELLSNGNYVEIVEANSGLSYREFVKDSYFIITKGYFRNGKEKDYSLTIKPFKKEHGMNLTNQENS